LFAAAIGMTVLLPHTLLADMVYRCGESYSTSNRCGVAAATEVKPTSVLHTTEHANPNRDLREAEALEKQRLQAEQQATQAAPIRLSTPSAPSVKPPSSNVTHNEPIANTGKRKGKHARKPNSAYFTAVDPTAPPKKKSTAKAVPSNSASGQ